MNTKDFEAEFLRRINALRIPFTIHRDHIAIKKYTVYVYSEVDGDDRKCNVCLYKNDQLVFDKPCTTYYLTQYVSSKLKMWKST